jgi:hypothetical protein
VTARVARQATPTDHPLLDGYATFCQALGLSDRALRDRLRLARRFLEAHPDLTAWMVRPLDARLADLARIRAWPLVTYAILTRRLPVDLELLVAKDLGGFGRAAEWLWPDDFTAARVAAGRLGWASNWTDAVLRECLALVIAFTGHPMRALDEADLDAFTAALDASTAATRWSRRAYRSRLHSLRQLLFEVGILDRPPRRGQPGASIAERLAVVPAPELRRVMIRYVEARAATLRPATVTSLTDALILLGEFLGTHHPRSPPCASSSATTLRRSWPGTGPGHGAAGSPDPSQSPPRSYTPPCWRCATSSTTSPCGAGLSGPPASSSSPATSPACHDPCPARSLPTSMPRSWPLLPP